MKGKSYIFESIVFIFGIASIFGYILNNVTILYLSKPVIIPLLLLHFFYVIRGKKTNFFYYIITSLVLYWLGDIFLLLETFDSIMFALYLSVCLTANVILAFAFSQKKSAKHKTSLFKFDPLLSFPIIVIALYFFYFLFPKFGDMYIPIFLYLASLVSVVIIAMARNNKTTTSGYRFIYRSSLLLFVSGIIILYVKFSNTFPYWGSIFSTTSLLSYFLISRGAIEHLLHKS